MKLRLLMLGAAVAASSAFAAPRGFTVEDLVSLERVGSPAVSPDAGRVVYTVRRTDLGKNRGHTSLWLADMRAAGAPTVLVDHDSSSTDPEWSPVGRRRLFPVDTLGQFPGLAPAGGRRRAGAGDEPAARRRQLPRISHAATGLP